MKSQIFASMITVSFFSAGFAQAESYKYNPQVSKCIQAVDQVLPLALLTSSENGSYKQASLLGTDSDGKECAVTVSIQDARSNDFNERQEFLDVTINAAKPNRTNSPRFNLSTHEFATKITRLNCSLKGNTLEVSYTGKALTGWRVGGRVQQDTVIRLKDGKIVSVSATTKRAGAETKRNTCTIK